MSHVNEGGAVSFTIRFSRQNVKMTISGMVRDMGFIFGNAVYEPQCWRYAYFCTCGYCTYRRQYIAMTMHADFAYLNRQIHTNIIKATMILRYKFGLNYAYYIKSSDEDGNIYSIAQAMSMTYVYLIPPPRKKRKLQRQYTNQSSITTPIAESHV